MSAQERTERSQAAASRLVSWLQSKNLERVGLFAAVRAEIQTDIVFRLGQEIGAQIALPRIVQWKGVLEFGWVKDWHDLVRGCYGIMEPVGSAVELSELEAIVVPGRGFDLYGGRLGYGAGWYDRTLEGYRGVVIGYGFDVQVVNRVPTESHDRPLDFVVTDERLLVVEAR